MSKRLTTEEFIKKAKEVHGDKYDYSKVVYVNSKTKVCIICPIHGEFWQEANSHLKGYGCFKCGVYSSSKRRTKDKELFISKARLIHGSKYNYSEVEYKNAITKVAIICETCGNKFWQSPCNHLSGGGCYQCVRNKLSKLHKKDLEWFLSKAKEKHGDKYDYSKVKYTGIFNKVCIICKKHGEFWQSPNVHLKGCGCAKCRDEETKKRKTKTTEEFITKARKVHGDKYDYSKVKYINNKTKVCIICPIHGEFWQQPSAHLNGQGCSKCHRSKGEEMVEEILKQKNIKYETQFNVLMDDNKLFSRNNLKVDFYLPIHNIIIEFHGIQHYEYIPFFHRDEDAFARQVDRDKRLREYCKVHKIKLIEIKYNQIDKIDKILNKKWKT